MDITPLVTAAASQTERSSIRLADTFDTFLVLLTAQLRNQDPLDPIDSSQFTEQLVMFSSAEQTIASNQKLETLIKLFQSGNASSAVNYLGTTVAAKGHQAVLSNGGASWRYELNGNAAQTTLSVSNSAGNTVFTGPGLTAKGVHDLAWDGKSNQGLPLPDGLYKLTVSAKDSNGQIVAITTIIEGVVDGVESLDDGVVLSISGVKIPLANIRSIKQTIPPSQPPAEG